MPDIQMLGVTLLPFSLWIVDDDETLVELLGDSLNSDPRLREVRSFTSPLGFLDALRTCRTPPDVVVLDIRMDRMDGLALLRKIRSTNARSRVVMCSALNDTTTLLDALAEGASGFLVKPATAGELVEAGIHAVTGLRPLNAAASTTLVQYVSPPIWTPATDAASNTGRATPPSRPRYGIDLRTIGGELSHRHRPYQNALRAF